MLACTFSGEVTPVEAEVASWHNLIRGSYCGDYTSASSA
jgi:hypothetical protein